MQNKKYKLIQCYPGSPKLGTILDKYGKVYKSYSFDYILLIIIMYWR